MKLEIFDASTSVGEAEFFALDPPMGVAMAKFKPSPAYAAIRHANVIDGNYIADRSDRLRVEMENGSEILSGAISIHDYPSLGEIEVHLLGIYQPKFEELFGDHPDFKAYWNAS